MKKKKHFLKNHKHMNHFIEICALLMLSEEKNHGYGLKEKLESFAFQKDQINVGTLYKTLRKMEDKKFVKSEWFKGDGGPKKRVYSLTKEGKVKLENWIDILKFRKARIEKVISRFERSEEK